MMQQFIHNIFATLLLLSTTISAHQHSYQCDPCIERSHYQIRAIWHGDEDDSFWQPMVRAAQQAATDMGVALELTLYKDFNPSQMAQDILDVVNTTTTGSTPVDALIVTLPTDEVVRAVADVRARRPDLPVVGMNIGHEHVASLGLQAFVGQDDYVAGIQAAKEILSLSLQQPQTVLQRALFVNQEVGNEVLEKRHGGFADTLQDIHGVTTETLVLEFNKQGTDEEHLQIFETALEGCPYDAILLGGGGFATIPGIDQVFKLCPNTLIGTFDVSTAIYEFIDEGLLAFGIAQNEYLQAVLPIQWAALYASTGNAPAEPSEGLYLSGPAIVDLDDLPSSAIRDCSQQGFPVCSANPFPASESSSNSCCLDRSKLRIGGVVHGLSTDLFWDSVFAGADQAASDMGVELIMERLDESVANGDTGVVDAMSEQIRSLCDSRVDALFVSLPSEDIVPAIQYCERFGIPIVSVNAGEEISQQLGLLHHIGQQEYQSGYEAGVRMLQINPNLKKMWCVNHEPETVSLQDRCKGFQDAVEQSSLSVLFMGTIEVPHYDETTEFADDVEAAVTESGDWTGFGFLLGGPMQVESAAAFLEKHSGASLASFDSSHDIFESLDEGMLLFGMDQQPYLQGYLPVQLLTHLVSSNQHLANEFVRSGPRFVTSSPTTEEITCQETLFPVCDVPDANSASGSDKNVGAIVGGTVGGGLLLALAVVLILCGAFDDSKAHDSQSKSEMTTSEHTEGDIIPDSGANSPPPASRLDEASNRSMV